MTQHFSSNTVSASHYCKKCGKFTQHRIDDHRKGPCLECIKRLEAQHAEQFLKERKQSELFA
jgi:ribosomal protein L44E